MGRLISIVDSLLASPISWGCVTLVLAAFALKGKFSMTAANYLLIAAGVTATIGIHRSVPVQSLDWVPRYLVTAMAASAIGIAVYYTNQWLDRKPEETVAATQSSVSAKTSETQERAAAPEPDIPVYWLFQSAWNDHKDALGNPKAKEEPLNKVHYAAYDHAPVIWVHISNTTPDSNTFYLLKEDYTYIKLPDPKMDVRDKTWLSDECNRKRFRLPEKRVPPYGGIAKLWVQQSWIGFRTWHSDYLNGLVYLQRFDNGFIIGGFRQDPLRKGDTQIFILLDNLKWAYKPLNGVEGPLPEEPEQTHTSCSTVVPISKEIAKRIRGFDLR